jgi:sialic acid synthase
MMKIGNDLIHDGGDCYVIAEIGHNHQGDLEKCKALFRAAQGCGVNAVKLQKRHNATLFTRQMYDSTYNSENAFGATYGAHREALEFGRDEYLALIEYAKELGVTFFSTAFDIPSADFLAELDMPAYKLASADLTNIPLLKHVASIGKPMIISTGGGTMEDVERAHDAIAPLNDQLAILQCTSMYPCCPESLNLRVIETFRNRFPDAVVGLSGHDNGIAMGLAAYMLGARIIEKHFTLDRTWKGTDHPFSLEPPGMRRLVRDLRRARIALGDGVKRCLPDEETPLKKMGKSVVAARPIAAGVVLGPDDLAVKSPGSGLPPYWIDTLLGKKTLRPLAEDEPLALDALEGGASLSPG